MKAFILAAGRGTRMRPLTWHTPKPLLSAGGTPLIEHTISALGRAGITQLVINHSWLGYKIEEALGTGAHLQVQIQYSAEPTPLETAGGIKQALTLLTKDNPCSDAPFIVVNGDIWTDYPFQQLTALALPPNKQAHLVMVRNPDHHPQGDFIPHPSTATNSFDLKQRTDQQTATALTYAGIGLYRPSLFTSLPPGPFPLAPVLREAMQQQKIMGELFTGQWSDIGTPERLAWLDQHLQSLPSGQLINVRRQKKFN